MSLIDELSAVYSDKPRGLLHITRPQLLAKMTCYSVADKSIGAFGIVKCSLNEQSHYLILLGGTEIEDGQATGIKEDILCGFQADNDYCSAVVKAIAENVPEGASLILAGLSLGGMIAQQVASADQIKKNYDVAYVICFGAPLIRPFKRRRVVRFIDRCDIVPFLSVHSLLSPISEFLKRKERRREFSEYLDPARAHALSYVASPIWDKYDLLGVKGGSASMIFDIADIKWYEALSTK